MENWNRAHEGDWGHFAHHHLSHPLGGLAPPLPCDRYVGRFQVAIARKIGNSVELGVLYHNNHKNINQEKAEFLPADEVANRLGYLTKWLGFHPRGGLSQIEGERNVTVPAGVFWGRRYVCEGIYAMGGEGGPSARFIVWLSEQAPLSGLVKCQMESSYCAERWGEMLELVAFGQKAPEPQANGQETLDNGPANADN